MFGYTALFILAEFADDAAFIESRFLDEADFLQARFKEVSFSRAEFSGTVRFIDAQFSDESLFGEARFARGVDFRRARFAGETTFNETKFGGNAHFDATEFSGTTTFSSRFSGDAHFSGARFASDALFMDSQFGGDTDFLSAHFGGASLFAASRFSGPAGFSMVEFSGRVSFDNATFARDADFDDSIFWRRATIGPIIVSGTLSFDHANFEGDLHVDACAESLLCRGTRFGARADLNVRWAEVALDNATFLQRSRLTAADEFPYIDDMPARLCRVDRRLDAEPRPRLVSLRQANVENLALGNVDLRPCRFFGAHGLDQLRIEADCEFAQPPARWRYTRRRTLAEEHHWQAGPRGNDGPVEQVTNGWHPGECQPPHWLTPPAQVLEPAGIAGLYRALRKALEDRKDEPGAADLYYGEMDMRRQTTVAGKAGSGAQLTGAAERTLLWLYWAVARYGLRASRAFATLVLTVVAFAVAFDVWGFQDQPFWRSLLFSAQSTIGLFRTPEDPVLEPVGEALQLPLRLLGPLFFGLAIFSLRGRVKR